MKKLVLIGAMSLVAVLTPTLVWAQRGGGPEMGGSRSFDSGSRGGGFDSGNSNVATPAIPPDERGERATPAMPGNPTAREQVEEHRRNGDSDGRNAATPAQPRHKSGTATVRARPGNPKARTNASKHRQKVTRHRHRQKTDRVERVEQGR